jgi:hypothetical protein
MEDTTMTKKEYMKPVMEVIEAYVELQILAGSVKSVTTTGLDDDLILPDDEEPKNGSVWEEAW